jgi:hypothetical protein
MNCQPLQICRTLNIRNKENRVEEDGRGIKSGPPLIYHSREGQPENVKLDIKLNGKVTIGKHTIRCGDFAFEFLRQHKTYHSNFSTEAEIKKIPFFINKELTEYELTFKADKYYLFSRKKFGLCLRYLCENMQDKTTLNIHMSSLNHSMALRVENKEYKLTESKTEKFYIIKFYDPDKTIRHLRIICRNVFEIEKLVISNLLADVPLGECLLSKPTSAILFGVYDETYDYKAEVTHPQDLDIDISFLSDEPEAKTNALLFFFQYNVKSELIKTARSILNNKYKSEARKCNELLAYVKVAGTQNSGLYCALDRGYVELIDEFMSIILKSHLTLNNKLEIITAKKLLKGIPTKIIPGLYQALHKGHTQAIIRYISIILEYCKSPNETLLIDEKILILLEAKDDRGISGLFSALENGHTNTASAFMKAILESNLPEDYISKLIRADYIGQPGLYVALGSGQLKAVKAFIEAIKNHSKLMEEDKLLSLLEAKRSDGVRGLYEALQGGHSKAACFYIEQAIHHFKIDLETLNIWMTLAPSIIGCKLHGILIAIAKDKNFLQELNFILSDSQRNELYQGIIREYEPSIEPYLLGEASLKSLGCNSNDEFWNAMDLSFKALKAEIKAL